MCGGEGSPPPSPKGASNLQPVLRHASVVSAQNWLTGELCVAVSPISLQRNLNLCGWPRSSSESRRPLDVISVCTRPGQHVTDRRGPYQHQVPGAEFGLGVRWRLALTSGVPRRPLGNPPVRWRARGKSRCRTAQWHTVVCREREAGPISRCASLFEFQGSITFPISSSPAGTSA